MHIFDDCERTYMGFESTGSFFGDLDRSARTDSAEVREMIEQWFSAYPVEHQSELRSRLRLEEDSQFRSAYFELFLHALLSAMGFRLTVHPQVPGTGNTPDFLVESSTWATAST